MGIDNKKLRCIIVDDETPAHKTLEFCIAQVDWLQLVGNYYNAFDAMKAIRELRPDIVFLDVTMPVMTGTEMLEELTSGDFHVIFVTANPKHQTQLSDPRIKGFVYKPVFGERFTKAIAALRPG